MPITYLIGIFLQNKIWINQRKSKQNTLFCKKQKI